MALGWRKQRGLHYLLALALLLCGLGQPVQAGPASDTMWLAQGGVDLKRAVRIAQDAYGGEVVKADEVVQRGQRRFQIRLVNNGRVRDVLVDAATGRILNP